MNYFNKNKLVSTLINNNGSTLSPLHQRTAWNIYCDKDLQMQNSSNLIPKAIASSHLVRSPLLPSSVPSGMQNDACQALAFSDPRQCTANSVLFKQSDQPVMSIDHGDLDIPWSELVLKEKIGAGIWYFKLQRTSQLHDVVLLDIASKFSFTQCNAFWHLT